MYKNNLVSETQRLDFFVIMTIFENRIVLTFNNIAEERAYMFVLHY
jgi:hypothetical protein